jgi:hypothetical protein
MVSPNRDKQARTTSAPGLWFGSPEGDDELFSWGFIADFRETPAYCSARKPWRLSIPVYRAPKGLAPRQESGCAVRRINLLLRRQLEHGTHGSSSHGLALSCAASGEGRPRTSIWRSPRMRTDRACTKFPCVPCDSVCSVFMKQSLRSDQLQPRKRLSSTATGDGSSRRSPEIGDEPKKSPPGPSRGGSMYVFPKPPPRDPRVAGRPLLLENA